MKHSTNKEKMHIVDGVRTPQLQPLKDGRFRVRFKRDGKEAASYFSRPKSLAEKAAIDCEYRCIVRQWINDRVTEKASGIRMPLSRKPLTTVTQALTLGDVINEFATEKNAQSEADMSRQRTRGASGRFSKNFYSQQSLEELLFVDWNRRMGGLDQQFMDGVCKRVIESGGRETDPWARQQATRVLRWMRVFVHWCVGRGYLTVQQQMIICDSRRIRSVVTRLKLDNAKGKSAVVDSSALCGILKKTKDDLLLRLIIEAQLNTAARPSEILNLSGSQIVAHEESPVRFTFAVGHKTDHFTDADPKLLPFFDELANRLAMLCRVAGESPIFTERMRAAVSASAWKSESEIQSAYDANSQKSTKAMNAGRYRKLLQQLDPMVAPYALRRFALTAIALQKTPAFAASFAGHSDLRTIMRYVRVAAPDVDKHARAVGVIINAAIGGFTGGC